MRGAKDVGGDGRIGSEPTEQDHKERQNDPYNDQQNDQMDQMGRMGKFAQQERLLDFYGGLLAAHRREICEAYIYQNLSLSEIAEQEGTSRQAVHDMIRRCVEKMQGYESQLQMIAQYEQMRERLLALRGMLESKQPEVAKLRTAVDEMIEDLG